VGRNRRARPEGRRSVRESGRSEDATSRRVGAQAPAGGAARDAGRRLRLLSRYPRQASRLVGRDASARRGAPTPVGRCVTDSTLDKGKEKGWRVSSWLPTVPVT
jgi:hypothetical protein